MDKEYLDAAIETVELMKDKDFISSLNIAKEEIERGDSFSYEDVFGEKL